MITVMLVRHADIDLPARSSDPPLNPAGQERAKALAHVAGMAEITALFTSPYHRTRQTLEPLASLLGVQPRVAPEPPALAGQVLAGAARSVVLIVGHSNTVPAIIAALRASPAEVTIGEQEFDNLFIVTITHQSGRPSMLRLKYGTPSVSSGLKLSSEDERSSSPGGRIS
jgi:broad specificity phosphatase PhoE